MQSSVSSASQYTGGPHGTIHEDDDLPPVLSSTTLRSRSYIPHKGRVPQCGKPLKMVDRHIRAKQMVAAEKARNDRRAEFDRQRELIAIHQQERAANAPPGPGNPSTSTDNVPKMTEDSILSSVQKATKNAAIDSAGNSQSLKSIKGRKSRKSIRKSINTEQFNRWVSSVCKGVIESPRKDPPQATGNIDDYSHRTLGDRQAKMADLSVDLLTQSIREREEHGEEEIHAWAPTVQDLQWVQRVWATCRLHHRMQSTSRNKRNSIARGVPVAAQEQIKAQEEREKKMEGSINLADPEGDMREEADDLQQMQMLAKYSIEERRHHARFSEEEIEVITLLLRVYDVDIIAEGIPGLYRASGRLGVKELAHFLSHTSWRDKTASAEEAISGAWTRRRGEDPEESGRITCCDAIDVLVDAFSISWWNAFKHPASRGTVGSITSTQFGQLLLDWGFADNWLEVDERFREVDEGDKGEIEFLEFCDALRKIRGQQLNTMRDNSCLDEDEIEKWTDLAKKHGMRQNGTVPMQTLMHLLVEGCILPAANDAQEILLQLLVQSCGNHRFLHLRDVLAGIRWCDNRARFTAKDKQKHVPSPDGVQVSRLQRAASRAFANWPICSEPELEQIRFFMESRWLAKINSTTEIEVSIYRSFFELYDRDNSGTADIGELFNMLADLEMKPKTLMEQKLLRSVMACELLQRDLLASDTDDDFPAMDLGQLVAVMTSYFRKMYEKVYMQNSREREEDGRRFFEAKFLLPVIYKCQEITGGSVMDVLPSEVSKWGAQHKKYDESLGIDIFEFPELEKMMVHLRERRMTKYMCNAGFTSEEVVQMREEFDKYDGDGSGEMEIAEVMTLLKKNGRLPRNKAEQISIKILIDSLDADGSGTLDFSEYLQLMRVWINDEKRRSRIKEIAVGKKYGNDEDTVEEFRKVFAEYDPNHSGRIAVREIEALLRSIGITLHGKDQGACRDIMKRVRQQDGLGYNIGANDVLDLNFGQFLEMLGQVLANDIAGISTAIKSKSDTQEGKQKVAAARAALGPKA